MKPSLPLIASISLSCCTTAWSFQLPVVRESGWTLRSSTVATPGIRSTHYSVVDDCTYFACDAGGLEGVYKIDATGALSLVAAAAHANGVVIDPSDGDVFYADLWAGVIHRIPFGTSTPAVWVSGFQSGDDDPSGMALAPADYAGPLLTAGEALVVDEGVNGSPRGIWRWSPITAQGEVRVFAGNGVIGQPTDVAISRSAIYFVDWDGGTQPGKLWQLNGVNAAALVATQGFLPPVGGVAIDPLNEELLLRSNDRILRLNTATGVFHDVVAFPASAQGVTCLDLSPDGRVMVAADTASNTVYVYERALVSSSDTAFALDASAPTLAAQLAALDATPPPFDANTWLQVARHADLHVPSSFACGASANPLNEPYVRPDAWLTDADEVTYDNCSSAWYRFTFQLPASFKAPRIFGRANVDDQGVLFLNGHVVSGLMTYPGCEPTSPTDPCYTLFDTGHDALGPNGLPVLTRGTPDRFATANPAWFRPGENELVFAVCGDAAPDEPTGVEFVAAVHWTEAASTYCTPKLDSLGCVPQLLAHGQPSLALGQPFEVRAVAVQNQKNGMLFYGLAPNAAPWSGGWLCVQAPIRRTWVQTTGGSAFGADCSGTLQLDFRAYAASGIDPQLVAGTEVFAQAWYRDPSGSAGSGLSGGLRFTLEP